MIWQLTDPLEIVKNRIGERYVVTHRTLYHPDATEVHDVDITERGNDDAPVIFHVEGRKSRVVAELLTWVNGQEGR